MALESTIQRNIQQWLKTLPRCEVRKHHASAYTGKGAPDLYGCIMGRSFFIEVKQPGETSRPDQLADQRKWRAAGALVGEAHSVDEARALLAPLLRELGVVEYSENSGV